jgi:hypothetical protein
LVNNFLFYAVAFVTITMLAPHSYFQWSTSLHGCYGLVTSHWHKKPGGWVRRSGMILSTLWRMLWFVDPMPPSLMCTDDTIAWVYCDSVTGKGASTGDREFGWSRMSKEGGDHQDDFGFDLCRWSIISVMDYVHGTHWLFSAGTECVSISCQSHIPLTDTHNSIETVSLMSSLFLALILSPQVQKWVQAELDVIVGRDRLPTFDDRPHLPYIDAICRELLRWWVVMLMGSIIPYQLPKSRYE